MLKHVDIYITHTIKGFVADNARYAYALLYNGVPRYGYGEIGGRVTQNCIVLRAMREALGRMRCPCEITLYMNSQYIANSFRNGSTKTWKQNGYKKAVGGKITDADQWETLLKNCDEHVVEVVYCAHHGMTEILNTGISRKGNFESLELKQGGIQ